MTSARLPALLVRYGNREAVKDTMKNREAMENGGKFVGSGKTKSFVSASWSGSPRIL